MFNNKNWSKPDSCDVTDFVSLKNLQKDFRRWKTILAGDDVNSIEQQMLALAWDDAVYRSFNEALKLHERSNSKEKVPSTIIGLLHRSFFSKQALVLRRLLDKRATGPNRAVYSLPTLLGEIRKQHKFITRQNYVCYDGVKYNPADRAHDFNSELACQNRHDIFDTLSLISLNRRSRDDLIDISIIDKIEKYFEKGKSLQGYINKYLAHGADPANRNTIDPVLSKISLRYLQDLTRVVIWASQTIGKIIDQGILTEVPTPQFNQFEGWENGLTTSRRKKALIKYWNSRVQFFDRWSRKYWDSRRLYRSPYDR